MASSTPSAATRAARSSEMGHRLDGFWIALLLVIAAASLPNGSLIGLVNVTALVFLCKPSGLAETWRDP